MRALRTHKALTELPIQRTLRVQAEGPVTLCDVADAARGDKSNIAVKVEVTCDPRAALQLCAVCGWYAELCDCGPAREARDRRDVEVLDAETEGSGL